jgi:hypothetical protein
MHTRLHEDSNLLVSIIEKEDSKIVNLAFSSADLKYHGMGLLKPEFIKSAKFTTTIFIVDKKISFGNNVDFNLLQRIIFPYTKDKTINAVGSSMGAYNAIIASNFIDISTIVAFVPMFSPSPKVIPGETRWLHFIDKVKTLHFESLEKQFNNKSKYYIIAGFSGLDQKQLCKMPKKSNIHKIYFKNQYFHHDVAGILNKENILYNVIEACYDGEPVEQIIQQHLNVEKYQCYSPKDHIE